MSTYKICYFVYVSLKKKICSRRIAAILIGLHPSWLHQSLKGKFGRLYFPGTLRSSNAEIKIAEGFYTGTDGGERVDINAASSRSYKVGLTEECSEGLSRTCSVCPTVAEEIGKANTGGAIERRVVARVRMRLQRRFPGQGLPQRRKALGFRNGTEGVAVINANL